MIDMRGVFSHPKYSQVASDFKNKFSSNELNCDEYWTSFMDVHKNTSNNKCPICEQELSEFTNKINSPTIDHFRPKADNKYPKLKCTPENYLLMCSLCNSAYKGDEFPLFDESIRATEAKTLSETTEEKPLLLNPAFQNPLDFFELIFKITPQGGILELKRNPIISKDSYEYKICETTVKLFGLGYCSKYPHPNDRVKSCRIGILTEHYKTFIELARIIKDGNQKEFALFRKNSENRFKELQKYGFFKFILEKQFIIEE